MTRLPFVAGILASALIAAAAQSRAPAALTAGDYVDIETAYARTLHDVGADDGARFAAAFTRDGDIAGTSGTSAGGAALARYAVSKRGTRHWITNLAIEPSRAGAVGFAYVVEGRGSQFLNGALYRDDWVKSPDGWRVRHRTVAPANAMAPRDDYTAPSNIAERAFTARDYFEIKHVIWRYNLGYDSAAPSDGGVLSSLLFTRDALFERMGLGDSTGRDELVAYAKERQTTGGTHHWDANLLLGAAADAVDAFSYLTTLSVPASGGPVRLSAGAGPLVHTFVRTPEGWLIKHRRYAPVATKPDVAWPAATFGLKTADIVERSRDQSSRGDRLGAVDYIEIQQLYARAAIAFDSARDHGDAFARVFTPDGSMTRGAVTTTGTAALTALAASNPPGVRTWISNMALEPAKGGARGRVYVLLKSSDADPVVDVGTFEDDLVRTRDGWRFKTRTYRSQISAAGAVH